MTVSRIGWLEESAQRDREILQRSESLDVIVRRIHRRDIDERSTERDAHVVDAC